MHKLEKRVKWFSVFVGLAFLLGYVAGLLLTGGGFTWSGLLATALVAGGLTLSVTILHGRSAGAFAVAALCVAIGALAYMVFVDPGLWVVVIVAFFWVALAGVAISGRERSP